MEEWFPLQSYPGYSASDRGLIRNDRRDRILTPSRNPRGHLFVGLMQDGVQVKRSVALLISQTFIPNDNPNFTTPIHLNGDLTNCEVKNMLWRPRWFARDFTSQFHVKGINSNRPVREVEMDEIYESTWIPVMNFGLLYMSIVLAIHNKHRVFPTWQRFEWAK